MAQHHSPVSTASHLTPPRPPMQRLPDQRPARGQPEAAEPLFEDWLQAQRGPLLRWALQCQPRAEERRDFMAQAMAVHQEGGPSALGDWLLWAAVMLARRAAEQASGRVVPMARLAPELRALLGLALSGTWRSSDVLALRRLPMHVARRALAAGQCASRVLPLC